MILEKEHRQALIFSLEKTIESISIKTALIESDKCPEEMKYSFDMDLFLLEKQKEIIEQSLINGEIDF